FRRNFCFIIATAFDVLVLFQRLLLPDLDFVHIRLISILRMPVKYHSGSRRCHTSLFLLNYQTVDTISCNSPKHIMQAFMMSDFCLKPPGDSDTRRSIFNVILGGCIPVFLSPGISIHSIISAFA
ncbi:putative xyloglucan galactosyltransferase GT14, partial [Bienertia sinuspersici]